MVTNLSVAEVLARLEQQIGYHREQEAFNAGWEAYYHERRATHAAQLEQLTRHFEALKAVAAATADLLSQSLPGAPTPVKVDFGRGKRFRLARIVDQLVERKAPQERFGSQSIAAEVNQLMAGRRLRRVINQRRVSVSLRWLAKKGKIFRVDPGRPHKEAHYVRERPAEAGAPEYAG
jgi:hypothetical protein